MLFFFFTVGKCFNCGGWGYSYRDCTSPQYEGQVKAGRGGHGGRGGRGRGRGRDRGHGRGSGRGRVNNVTLQFF